MTNCFTFAWRLVFFCIEIKNKRGCAGSRAKIFAEGKKQSFACLLAGESF